MNMVDLSSCAWRKSSRSDSSGAECVEVASVSVKEQKSSYSTDIGGQCVEVASMAPTSAAEWKRSSRSTNTGGQCVEIADLRSAAVAVRDSKDPDGPKLVFAPDAWQAFANHVKGGTLDLT